MRQIPFTRPPVLPLLAALGLVLAAPAHSAMIDINVSTVGSISDAQTALDNYRSSKRRVITEDFEGFAAWNGNEATATADPLSTSVGSFQGIGDNGTGTSCVSDCDNIQVADDDSDGLGGSGRKNTTDGGANWLDSNDIEGIEWIVDASGIGGRFTDLAFFLSDVADVGATLNVTFDNGMSESAEITPTQPNGTINFVTARFADFATGATVSMLNTNSSTTNDGFGVDDVTVAVPAPATLALLGLGLLGLAGMRRAREV